MNLDDVLPLFQARLSSIIHPAAVPVFSDYDLSDHRPDACTLKQAAVLVPLIMREHGLSVLLTRRSDDLPTHAGQIAFPGGRCVADDANVGATALREAHEEVGLNPLHVTLIGTSDAYETVTRFAVTPVIGLVDAIATFTPDPT